VVWNIRRVRKPGVSWQCGASRRAQPHLRFLGLVRTNDADGCIKRCRNPATMPRPSRTNGRCGVEFLQGCRMTGAAFLAKTLSSPRAKPLRIDQGSGIRSSVSKIWLRNRLDQEFWRFPFSACLFFLLLHLLRSMVQADEKASFQFTRNACLSSPESIPPWACFILICAPASWVIFGCKISLEKGEIKRWGFRI
jgi:hypothetical protein